MAKIVVKCPNPACPAAFRVDEAHAGKAARCKKCGTRFVIEAAPPPGPRDRPVTESPPRAGGQVEPWSAGKVLLDEYEVERQLGAGGTGVVYLVRSRRTGHRFAAKQILAEHLRSPERRRSFLRELQTWIDLPEHPHLTACRFFRTVEDRVVIFAEYVSGGSLHEWIRSGRLYEPAAGAPVEGMLEIAIQSAWGLDAAHRQGLVHQDVKPRNVLMTADGAAKVTDFGLARALAGAAGQAGGGDTGPRGAGVAYAGMTPEYCSPEQARRGPLTHKTDVWSWGLSVLEMFAGTAFWSNPGGPTGHLGARVLEQYLRTGPEDARIPPMPQPVAEILQRCFRDDPAERWAAMSDAADALNEVYESITGCACALLEQADTEPASVRHDRRTKYGQTRRDPREWLRKALDLDGGSADEAEQIARAGAGSRRAQGVGDLAIYEEAAAVYNRLVAAGRGDLEDDLAALYVDKAFVHEATDDLPGALRMFDLAAELYERLVSREGRSDLTNELAGCYMNKANNLCDLGNYREAAALYDRAIELGERLLAGQERPDLILDLARTCMNKATALRGLGDHRAAVPLCDRAIELYQRLPPGWNDDEATQKLAACYVVKANALSDLGDPRGAVALYDRAIQIHERLVYERGREELSHDLGLWYINKANSLGILGDHQGAVQLHDRAIELFDRLVRQEGRWEVADRLAGCCMNKANALRVLERPREALPWFDRALEIYDRLVNDEGRWDLADDLARCCLYKAIAFTTSGDRRAALPWYDRATQLRERLVYEEGRSDLTDDLARCYLQKAIALNFLGDPRAAFPLSDRAVQLRQWLVHEQGRSELVGDLAHAQIIWACDAGALGREQEARRVARQAYEVLKSEVRRTGRDDLAGVLQWARQHLGSVLPP